VIEGCSGTDQLLDSVQHFGRVPIGFSGYHAGDPYLDYGNRVLLVFGLKDTVFVFEPVRAPLPAVYGKLAVIREHENTAGGVLTAVAAGWITIDGDDFPGTGKETCGIQ
jgi:hypothetical protein